ncbi:SMI1/KNR4 family protein [Domibacillus indicus]|uniref:SMI1/KNR4 family protein n=1 Tax=Domibacillus indicus TaxID=1437523 RepID=UPI00203B875F|nr:SMI1/KNR4 family protein [Domibacillus indicus]MCM3791516.1 SMI1/KNR4 family protein [Domibacillus indicus]
MNKMIWAKDEDDLTLQPLTEEMIRYAEKELDVTLPEAYINMLKEKNGGYMEPASYPTKVPTSWADDHIQIDYMKGIGEAEGILESFYLIEEWDLPDRVVLLSGDGHTWIALDYRNTDQEPPVIYIDTEDEQIFQLAPNFAAFVDGLKW